MTLRAGLSQLLGSFRAGAQAASAPQRWVMLDVESSGLDAKRDRLIAIAAIGVKLHAGRPHIDFGDSFEVVLQQPELNPDKQNILLHGIGVGAQRAGTAPAAALQAFRQWLGTAPLIAFHAAFDQTLIQRAMRSALRSRLANRWVDLQPVASALLPELKASSLDPYLDHFGIHCLHRHQAAADALASAELLLKLWPAIVAQDLGKDFAALQAIARQGRWLQR
jgi:DNA polymerase-3 subunit epsilon